MPEGDLVPHAAGARSPEAGVVRSKRRSALLAAFP